VKRDASSGRGRGGGAALTLRFFVLFELFGDEDAGAARDDYRQLIAFKAVG
jgi:hypothetical protein